MLFKSKTASQPRGLFFLAATEFWDRISFHGMQALLVLFMVEELLLPGHIERIAGFSTFRGMLEWATGPLSVQALASQIFGLYVGLVFLTPLLGGFIGDRLLGRTPTIILGAVLLTAGHFCMAFEQPFLIALLLLVLGAGCLRGNLLAQVGSLYDEGDARRAAGFQIYVALLNGGALCAPLISGWLAQRHGWHSGFAFAGFGMLAGLLVYLYGLRHLPARTTNPAVVNTIRLSRLERRTVRILIAIVPLFTLFWIAQAQVWNVYNLWARDHVNLMVGGWTLPIPWLQTFDGMGAVGMVPPLLWLWRFQAARSREPDELSKITLGFFIYAASILWLAAGSLVEDVSGKVPLAWVLVFHLVSQVGYLFISPVAVSLFSRLAPAGVNATLINVYYLSAFAGSAISGRLGGLYERMAPSSFWILHAALAAAGGLLILILAPILRRALFDPRDHDQENARQPA